MNKPRLLRWAVFAFIALAVLWFFVARGEVVVILPEGVSAARAAEILKSQGVISSSLAFRALVKALGAGRKIKAGAYRLKKHAGLFGLIHELESGSHKGVKVVIPEGFSARQIGERLEALGICPAKDFEDYALKNRLEGYLFPSTYYFDPKISPEKAAGKMTAEFSRIVEFEYDRAFPKPLLSLRQTLTLASIVQREAVLPQEKPMIAAVYLNRLRLRMRLEADPTVQYAIGFWKRELTSDDLRADSPYNTYIYYGLPPGPICSPGLDSFLAVLHPARTDDLYFVADNNGGHRFAVTNEEHIENKRLLKEALRAEKDAGRGQKR